MIDKYDRKKDRVWIILYKFAGMGHTTNTFCTERGDMSIFLWDMWVIHGLPAGGSYYEEVVPSARELLAVGQDNKQLKTCTFLFSASHRLCQDVNGVV